MNQNKKFIIITFLISIYTVLAWCTLPIGNTFFWFLVQSLSLFIFYKATKYQKKNVTIINLFLCYVIFSAIYGLFSQAEVYWDYKLLYNNLLIFLLPILVYTFHDPMVLISPMRSYLRYSFFLLLLLSPFIESDAFGRFLVPFTILALFFPLCSKKIKIAIVLSFVISLTLGRDSRCDIIKNIFCLAIGLLIYRKLFRNFYYKIINYSHILFLILPFVLFGLGVSDIFNVFRIQEVLGIENAVSIGIDENGNEISALVDTRTFLFEEEIGSAIKYNYYIQGRSIARGYETFFFFDMVNEQFGMNRGERQGCEVSILNIFNYFGLIGCILYFLIFVQSSYLAIYKSNNGYLPLIGLYVSFRWVVAWIEDFTKFDLNYVFLWILIGICFSERYRQMTNSEFETWFKSLISVKK